jgi:hypothetical protein
MMVRLSALRADRPLPEEDFWYSFLLRVWVNPKAILQLEGLAQFKNPLTLGIEPMTFQLVA